MSHIVERAPTGRAICRGCGARIAAGEHRFGERLPNPYGDDGSETTRWFHLACAAFTRPEPFLEALATISGEIDDKGVLEQEARLGVAHHRLPRVRAAERAASGRAACRSCHQPIAKGAWRIVLAYYEDGRFAPAGFIHVACAAPYLETAGILHRLKRFSPALTDADVAEAVQLAMAGLVHKPAA